jgi:NADH-quinone oxidoreductase subunit L
MTWPLIILAAGSILLGFMGTPVWPWFQSFILGEPLRGSHGLSSHVLITMAFSTLLIATGITVGWLLYSRRPITSPEQPDVLESWNPDFFGLLRRKFLVDELYDLLFVQPLGRLAGISDIVDRYLIGGIVQVIAWTALAFGWLDRLFDKFVIDLGFDRISQALSGAARSFSRFQNGQIQRYLKVMALGMAILALAFLWGCAR